MSTYPLSQTQTGIYLSELNATGNADYNIDMLYYLDNGIDIERVRNAIMSVLENHRYVCSRLLQTDDGEIRIVPELSPLNTDEWIRTYVTKEALTAEMQRKFDLLNEPLARFGICTAGKETLLGICFHHIVFDGLSFSIFRKELEMSYDGMTLIPEEKDGFSIAQEEEAMRGSEAYREAADWYAGEFAAAADVESLPLADIYETVTDSNEWKKEVFPLSAVSESDINGYCRLNGVGESVPFTLAFGFTLACFCGDDKALYSTIFHGRTDKKTLRSLGMMVKTLPVFNDFGKTGSIAELMRDTYSQMRDARCRTIYSYGEFCNDLSVNPQACIAFQGPLYDYDIILNGRRQKSLDLRVCRPGYALMANVYKDIDGTYKCMLQYSRNQYSDSFVCRFCQMYGNVLKEMLVRESVSDVSLVDAEQLKLLDSYNPAPCSYPDGETVVSLFRKAALSYPDNIAVVFRDRKITYRELDAESDRIALSIHSNVVSILIGRSENMAVFALAALKAGAAYQPLDPSYPEDRLNFMLKDSGSGLLIADRQYLGLISGYDGEIMEVTDGVPVTDADSADTCRNAGPLPQDAFILLYTSGSTGVPKGVILEHGNLVSFCHWYHRYYNLEPESRVAAYASFGFDANMMDMYPALTRGAAVVIVPEEIRLDLDALSGYLADNGVTHSFMTTQVGYQFASLFPVHKTLRHLSVGGEKLASINPPSGYAFYNCYGPTECTIFSTAFKVTENERNIPIGTPVGELSCYILSKFGKRLPAGAAGELVVTGPQVGRGYHNRPDKTAEAFGVFGERSYRTGDVVRYRDTGDIEFVGRRDGQVKIRGFRIELKEVEAVIREFGGISDATVQAFDGNNGGKYIAAYIVSDRKINVDSLNDYILSKKPAYMVPAVTMQIDAIPLNVNQKVDKKRLPVPEVSQNDDSENVPRELNVLEKTLMDMAVAILGNELPSLTAPLAHYGLSSILSMHFAAQLHKRFGVKITSVMLLDGASLLDIENVILENAFCSDTVKSENTETDVTSVKSGTAELSFSQQGVFVDCMANPESAIYNIPMAVEFPLSVSTEALENAVRRVIEAHPILFARFSVTGNGDVVQTVPVSRIAVITVKNIPFEDIWQEKRGFVRPFDLMNDMLWRAEIISSSEGHGPVLLADIHHLVCDGGSYDVLIREIIQILSGCDVQEESYTYLDFCRAQKSFAESDKFNEHKAFFDSLLADFETVTEIQPDVVSDLPGKLAEVAVEIPDKCMSIKQEGVTAAHFWMAATAYVIGRFTNSRDIYISTVSSGRQNLDISDTVGMFVNTLPVAFHLSGKQTVSDFLKAVSEVFRSTMAHENYPFARIAADYGYTSAVTYAYQLDVLSDYRIDGESIPVHSFGLDAPKFKTGILIELYNGHPSVVIQYDDSLYSVNLMRTLAESIVAAACNMAGNMERTVTGISILSDGQREVLESMHSIAGAVSTVNTFHEGIERWALKTPDAVAVVACDRTLTYAEFDSEANRIAGALQARGLSHGDRVVLLLPRCSDFLVSLFAVMKCGAAYIPMDPEYPADRISYILNDSCGRFVITTKEKCAYYKEHSIDIDELKAVAAGLTDKAPSVTVSSEDLAYLIYTSGSTGTPKGVMLQHRGICNYLSPHPANPHTYAVVNGAKGVVCSATVSFDLSILEYGTALFNGKMLVFADEQSTTDSLRLAELYRTTGADVLSGTPSRIETYMEIEEYRDVVRQCKVIQMGGEKLPASLLHRLQDMTDAGIYNMYGPTEITICCNAVCLSDSQNVTVGKPLPGFSEYIIDSDGNELPVGVTGELLICGVGVSPGYNNLPEKTAAAFVEWNGMRGYKSGDYAKWDENGNVVILGRTDHQVKLNGLRIELGEIESVMGQQPGIRQCVVLVKKVGAQDKLVAYYTTDGPCDEDAVKSGMAEHLTYYMVPGIFVRLDAMPVTPAGKTDIKNLPEPVAEVREYVGPRNDVERFFCKAIAETLNLERVGVNDNFFEIGGTSLVAMRLSVTISHGGYNVAYKDIFEHPTPAEMAGFVSGNAVQTDVVSKVDDEISNYDYNRFEKIVKANVIDTYLNDQSTRKLGRVFLTGATGYLGVHILYELLVNPEIPAVYCLVRGNKAISAASRLHTLLYYYFGSSFKEEDGKRLFVIEGDVTKPFDLFNESVDTIINCAANVKHFSAGTDIEDINIGGVRNCIELALRMGALFIQTSTGSVGGITISGEKHPKPHTLLENELYFGQSLDNKYLHSKFLAERAVLEAIAERGLKAKIMRLGNLAPRSQDGEFQMNFHSNSYMGRLKAYQTLGAVPYSALVSQTEFSPIDDTARAVLLLSATNSDCVIFNVVNSHRSLVMDVINCMNKIGYAIEAVDSVRFADIMNNALKDAGKAEILQSMLAYSSRSDGQSVVFNNYGSDYTSEVLLHLGFHWNITTWDYMEQFLLQIQSLGFFDEDYER